MFSKADGMKVTRQGNHCHKRGLSMRQKLCESVDPKCKLVDFGSACWTYKQFTNDIQTRQYTCPEVILGSKYSTSADLWSFACICFELATGDALFDPHSDDNFDRDEDHLALMMERLGMMPRKFTNSASKMQMTLLTSWFPYLILSQRRDQQRPNAYFIHGLVQVLAFYSPPLKLLNPKPPIM